MSQNKSNNIFTVKRLKEVKKEGRKEANYLPS